jgi:hypothetical protein
MHIFISNTKIKYTQSADLVYSDFLMKISQIVSKMDFSYV